MPYLWLHKYVSVGGNFAVEVCLCAWNCVGTVCVCMCALMCVGSLSVLQCVYMFTSNYYFASTSFCGYSCKRIYVFRSALLLSFLNISVYFYILFSAYMYVCLYMCESLCLYLLICTQAYVSVSVWIYFSNLNHDRIDVHQNVCLFFMSLYKWNCLCMLQCLCRYACLPLQQVSVFIM